MSSERVSSAGFRRQSQYGQGISRLVGSGCPTRSSVLQQHVANAGDTLHDASRLLLQRLRVRGEEFRTLRLGHTDLHAFHIAHSTVGRRARSSHAHLPSPIRYADVLVHRLLAAGIQADATFPDLLNKRVLQQICNNLNYRHRMAQYAARASVDLHTQVCRWRASDQHAQASRSLPLVILQTLANGCRWLCLRCAKERPANPLAALRTGDDTVLARQ